MNKTPCAVSTFFGSETFNIKEKNAAFEIFFNLQSQRRARGMLFSTGAIRNQQVKSGRAETRRVKGKKRRGEEDGVCVKCWRERERGEGWGLVVVKKG